MTRHKDYQTKRKALKRQLQAQNVAYMEKFEGYLLMAAVFTREDEVLEQILQLYGDVVQAQADGLSAEAFLGKTPKQLADELSHQFSRQPIWQFLGQTLSFFCLYEGVVALVGLLVDGVVQVSPWVLLLDLAFIALIPALLHVLRFCIYGENGQSLKIFLGLGLLVVALLFGRGFVASQVSSIILPTAMSRLVIVCGGFWFLLPFLKNRKL